MLVIIILILARTRNYTVSMNELFDHEKLTVYQDSTRFVVWAGELLETLPKSLAAYDQLDRASASIPLNIAEGNG